MKFNGRLSKSTSGRKHIAISKFSLTALAVSAVIVLVLCIFAVSWRNHSVALLTQDTFYPGVKVEGLDLGGKTKEQGLDEIKNIVSTLTDDVLVKLTFDPREYGATGQPQSWEFNYIQLVTGGRADTMDKMMEEIIVPKLDEAYLQGRQGSTWQRLHDISKIKRHGWNSKIDVNFDVLNSIKPELEKIKSQVAIKPKNATVLFDTTNITFTPVNGQVGYTLDTAATFNEIKAAFNNSRTVNLRLKLAEVMPEYTSKDVSADYVKLVSYTTDYSSSTDNRKSNIRRALASFDGRAIWPGEVVSFNLTTGERTEANGYQMAHIIGRDKNIVDGLGGGVCQASTTLYVATRLMRLDIMQRAHHSFPSTYVPKGFDSTVNWPDLDLKFRNNRKSPVFIRTVCTDRKVTVEYYGIRADGDGEYDMVSEITQTTPAPATQIIEDKKGKYVQYKDQKENVVLPRDGFKVNVYLVRKDSNGMELTRTLLYDDTYSPIGGKTYVGVKDRPGSTGVFGPTVVPNATVTNNRY